MKWLQSTVVYNKRGLVIDGNSIVERWEKPIQQILANAVFTRPNANILEIGYGLGYATKQISLGHPSIHILVEAHPLIAKKAKIETNENTSIIVALWQDAIKLFQEQTFDGIVFDAYPLEGLPYTGTTESSLNFIQPFLDAAHFLLKSRGKLSFLDFSCGIHLMDSFSNFIGKFFNKVEVIEVSIKIPKNCSYATNNKGNVIVLTK